MKYLLIPIVVLFSLRGPAPGKAYRIPPEQEKCITCHDDILKFKNIHPVMEDGCETCHQPQGPSHPEKDSLVLVEKVPALCFICHDNFNKNYIHPPASEGACLSCPSPHRADYSGLLLESREKLCSECHTREKPAGFQEHFTSFESSCNDCHDAHQSDHASLLKDPEPALCFQCHEDETKSEGVEDSHVPYAEGSCSTCHQPHGSVIPGLLTEAVPALCYECHEQNAPAYPHDPVKKGKCIACHNPHASQTGSLLAEDNKGLCLKCHSRSYQTDTTYTENIGQLLKKDPYVHGAIEMDGCASCHAGHGTEYRELLKNKYPTGYYTEAKAENFALCFDCHDAAILEKDPATSGTNFRNGGQNLHYMHINGAKGRSCSMCHGVHAAKNEHLIREKVPYGRWTMNMNYKPAPQGGSCMPGCHGELTYDRSQGN